MKQKVSNMKLFLKLDGGSRFVRRIYEFGFVNVSLQTICFIDFPYICIIHIYSRNLKFRLCVILITLSV